MSVQVADSSNKPRILLSIVKCACLESSGDNENLFTAITAGFGRFECERLLKPSGVELMNLPPSANIEISVLRRDQATNQKQLLFHGIVPLVAVQPHFSNGSSHTEPQVWENWLGLFGAEQSLKEHAPEKLFQQCLEMGKSNARFPRLLVRMQYLQASAAKAVPAGMPPTSGKRNPSPPFHTRSFVGTIDLVGPVAHSGHQSVGLPAGPDSASPMVGRAGSTPRVAAAVAIAVGNGRTSPRVNGLSRPSGLVGADRPDCAGAAKVRSRSLESVELQDPVGCVQVASGTASAANMVDQARNVTSDTMTVSITGGVGPSALAGVCQNTNGGLTDKSSQFAVMRSQSPRDRRQQHDVLSLRSLQCPASWDGSQAARDESRKALESTLQEAEKKANGADGAIPSQCMAMEQQRLRQQQQSEEELPQRGRDELASYVWQCTELQKQVAELQKRLQQAELEKAQIQEREALRIADNSDRLERMLQRARPVLKKLGRPVCLPELGEVEAITEKMVQEIVAALADVADEACAAASRRGQHEVSVELVEDLLTHAVQGASAFDTWLQSSDLTAEARKRSDLNERLMALCRQVAIAASCPPTGGELPPSVGLAGAFYTPVKTDPTDCLLAAELLRFQGPTPNFIRLRPGLYRFGSHGLRLRCRVHEGALRVRVVADADDDDSSPGGLGNAVGLSTFLAEQRGVMANSRTCWQ